MKKCLRFFRNSKYNYEADELIINYKETDQWRAFLDLHSRQRVIVPIESIEQFDMFISNDLVTDNLTFLFSLDSYNIDILIEKAKKLNIDYYFHTIATNWTSLNRIKELNPYSIYIGEDLCFDLPAVRKVCGEDILIRVIPNIPAADERSFYIRPEDIEIYEPYIDIIEFAFPYDRPDMQDTLFDIYFETKEWIANLNIIIPNIDAANPFIPTNFGELRLQCHYACMCGRQCNLCKSMISIANKIAEVKNGSERTRTEEPDSEQDIGSISE